MRISEADNLAGVAGVGKDFLVAGERGIENDFAAPAGSSARRATVKDSPVLEREKSGAWGCVGQRSLLQNSFSPPGDGRNRAKTHDGPVGENGFAVDELAGDSAEDSRVVGTGAMVAHNEKRIGRNALRAVGGGVGELRGDVRLIEEAAVHKDAAGADLDGFARKTDHALDEGLAAVERIPEDDHVAALNGAEVIDELVDENALLIAQKRRHAGAFDFDGLIEKNNDDDGEDGGDEKVAGPGAKLAAYIG